MSSFDGYPTQPSTNPLNRFRKAAMSIPVGVYVVTAFLLLLGGLYTYKSNYIMSGDRRGAMKAKIEAARRVAATKKFSKPYIGKQRSTLRGRKAI
jgi:hypothetical protein